MDNYGVRVCATRILGLKNESAHSIHYTLKRTGAQAHTIWPGHVAPA